MKHLTPETSLGELLPVLEQLVPSLFSVASLLEALPARDSSLPLRGKAPRLRNIGTAVIELLDELRWPERANISTEQRLPTRRIAANAREPERAEWLRDYRPVLENLATGLRSLASHAANRDANRPSGFAEQLGRLAEEIAGIGCEIARDLPAENTDGTPGEL
jgi:hypothetical protein